MKKLFKKINRIIFLEKREHLILFRLVSFLLIIAFLTNLFVFSNQTALGATYTFNQTSWAGGMTANNAVHPTNQSSWNQFSASTTGMTTANSGADLQMLLIASSTIHTTDTDFSAGNLGASTTISGTGSGASVKFNTGVDLGTGSDGALTVSSVGQNINTYASAGANDYSTGATSITVDSTTGFSTGDEVLVIQMQHASNAGKYEFVDSITVVNSTTISFSTGLTNSYYGTGSSGKTQVIRVPQYTNVTVNSGASIIPTAWSNATGKGGIVVFRANGTVTVTGSIDASGKGFTGGAGMGTDGTQGESYGGLGIRATPSSANYGGGGGGEWLSPYGSNYYNSGGGGGYSTVGGSGSGYAANNLGGGVGGLTYGTSLLSTFFVGSGGGGGASSGGAGSCGKDGGNGGGSIFMSAYSVSIGGTLKANGSNGGAGGCEHIQGGGGGSGGSIFLTSLSITVGTSLVQATGGAGGSGSGGAGHNGGAGGNGRIRLDYSTLSGTTNPSVGYTSAVVLDTSGIFTSSIIDYGANSNFTTLAYTKTTPTNTTATFDIRAGNTVTPDGSWTSWQTDIANGGSISALNDNRYVQYRANLSRTDTSVTLSLDDITINSTQYATSTNLISSPYNTSDSANVLSSIQWTESLASGTDVKFQLRTASDSSGSPGTWTGWLGPDGTSATYFTDPTGTEAMPSAFTSGGNDQWVQYKVFMTSTGVNTPTLSDITLTYVVNAAPSIQTVTASQGSAGTVSIAYEVKDTDTNSGTVNPGYITPSFEYWDGASWSSITSGLATLATTTKAVNQSTFTSYSTVWTASTTIGSQYYSAAKIRVTANDGEAANNTANAESSTFVLDTSAPASNSVKVSAITSPSTITLASTDNSALQMKVGLSSDLSDASWESYATSKTVSLATDPDTVYAKFKDAYGNESSIISATTPATPINMIIQDNSNASTSESRLFVAWGTVALPSPGFGSYSLYRSTDSGATYSSLTTITNRNTNYYMDTSVSNGSSYSYKVSVLDASDNSSYYSSAVSGTVNATQDTSEGGGGSSSVLPAITIGTPSGVTTQSAVINWTTDVLSTSVVGYCAGSCEDFTTNQVSLSSYSTSHSVAIGGLSAGASYNYKVFSSDIRSNLASSTVQTFSTNSGPSISNVSITSVTGVSADITWNTDSSSSGYVVYSTTNPPSGNESGSASSATTRTISLTSLSPGSKYYFYVKSQAGGNWAYDYNTSGGENNYYSFTTPIDGTAPVIYSVASTTQRTAASITWNTDELSDSKVIYGLTTNYGSETSLDSTLTRIHSLSLSGLAPSTIYHYKMISTDASGNRATSTDYSLITESMSLTSISATTISNTSTGVSWTTSDNSTSQVEYSSFADLTDGVATPSSPSDSTTSHSISLSSLSQATTYYYRVKSSSNGLATTTSQIYQFTTGDATAPVVSSITASPVIDTSAVITWTTNEPSTSKVEYGTNSGVFSLSSTLDSTQTVNHSVSLSSLSYGTKYYYRVLSTDGNNNATTSVENTFTTLEQQIGISQQTVTTTTAVSGGGGGSVFVGVPQDRYDTLLKERDLFKKENDDLRNKILGINSNSSTTPVEIISIVIDKFTEIVGNISEASITAQDENQDQSQAEKLEKDILPAVISLRQLTKLVPPPKLKTEPKIDIGPTHATVSWLTDKLATSIVYFSESKDYNKQDPDTYTNSAEDSKNYVTDHKIALKGLSPLSDYHYRLMSESEAGAKAYSADFTFTTKPEMPKIFGAKAEKSGDTSIVVSWRTNIPANSVVVYTPVIAGKADPKKSKSEGVPDFSQEHSITIPRLEPSTIYNLEVSSADHFGNVVVEKLEPMSIAKDETPPAITQVRNESSILSGASSNKVQAIFYWKTDEPATTKIIYSKGSSVAGKEENFDGKSALNEELSLNHIAVITSWEPGEIYRFRAVSTDAYGNESQSKTFAVIAPKQKATVVDLIINNFSDTFDWTKKMGF